MAEMLGGGTFREGAKRPQKRHGQRTLERKTCGHDLAEEPGDALIRQGAGIHFLNPPQDLRLALRAVDKALLTVRRLDLPDVLGTTRPPVQ